MNTIIFESHFARFVTFIQYPSRHVSEDRVQFTGFGIGEVDPVAAEALTPNRHGTGAYL